MELKPFKTIDIKDNVVSRQFGYVKEYFDQFKDNNFLKGNLITADYPNTVSQRLNHGLGRVPVGWLIMDKTTDANVWRLSWDEKEIRLDVSAATTLTIWVF